MDVTTHFLVPYAAAALAAGLWKRHDPDRAALAVVVGLAGFAPDLDGALDPLSERFDNLYWLQHRGVSHTLVGAPLFALALVGALSLLARWQPRTFGAFRWRHAFAPAAVAGAWSHLALDAVTYSGVPALWPFAFGRVGFPVFHWVVIWLFPVGLVAIGLAVWRKLSHAGLWRVGVAFVVVLVVLAGVRAATRPPDAGEGALVYPRGNELEWTVLRSLDNGTWEAHVYRLGERSSFRYFENTIAPGAETAVEAARATGPYKGFLMGRFGPEVVQASHGEKGSWNVTFIDAAARFEALNAPRWTPTEPHEDWGYVAFRVHADGRVEAAHRGW